MSRPLKIKFLYASIMLLAVPDWSRKPLCKEKSNEDLTPLMTAKMIESDTDRKNAQKVMITITMVKFPVIAGYGTKPQKQGSCQISQYFQFSLSFIYPKSLILGLL